MTTVLEWFEDAYLLSALGLKTGTIVTRNETQRIDTGGKIIEVIPAWRYLLDPPESRVRLEEGCDIRTGHEL